MLFPFPGPEAPSLVGRGQLARLLQFHNAVATTNFTVAALGAKHTAAAGGTTVTFAQLVGHYFSSMGTPQQDTPPSPPLVTINSDLHWGHT